jgi:hypothetical protein
LHLVKTLNNSDNSKQAVHTDSQCLRYYPWDNTCIRGRQGPGPFLLASLMLKNRKRVALHSKFQQKMDD